MMKFVKKHWIALLLMIAPFVLGAVVYDRLPQEIPIHFNIQGEADNWADKNWAVWLLAAIGPLTFFLVGLLAKIDPKKNYEKYKGTLNALRYALLVFFLGIFALILLEGIQRSGGGFTVYPPLSVLVHDDTGLIDTGRIIVMMIIGLMVVLGNFMGKTRPNYFIGIRTPWTLENEQVWVRTHRMAGALWVFSGLALIVLGFLLPRAAFFIAGAVWLAVIVVTPLVYSYLLHKRLRKAEQ